MSAINQCYVAYIVRTAPERWPGSPPKPCRNPMTNEELIACMEAQNFQFCNNCQIFRYSGGPCRDDKENGPHRATCWRERKHAAEIPKQYRGTWCQTKWATIYRRCD